MRRSGEGELDNAAAQGQSILGLARLAQVLPVEAALLVLTNMYHCYCYLLSPTHKVGRK